MTQRLIAVDVRAWRKDTGLSCHAFGTMLGISANTVRAWEGGRLTPKRWVRLARMGWYAQRSMAEQLRRLHFKPS